MTNEFAIDVNFGDFGLAQRDQKLAKEMKRYGRKTGERKKYVCDACKGSVFEERDFQPKGRESPQQALSSEEREMTRRSLGHGVPQT